MSIKDILGSNGKPKEYFWALVVEPGWVQAGVWRIFEEKTQIISVSSPTAWEIDENLLSATDAALSASIQDFPEEAKEPEKVVFGIVSSWTEKGEIGKEYLEKVKRICSKLSLTPVGFVVLPEAIAHFIKSEEGSPLNAVILGISKDEIEVSVFKLGKLIGTSSVGRSLSVIDDVIEGLSRFSLGENLPSRFILYNGKEGELEEVRQTLIKANWDDFPKVKFLHTPKVEIISPKMKVHAAALAGASELADVTSIYTKKEERREKKEEAEEELENVVPVTKPISAEKFGFTVGEDIAEKTVSRMKEEGLKGTEVKESRDITEVEPREPLEPEKVKKPRRINRIRGVANIIKSKIPKPSGLVKRKLGERAGKNPIIFGVILFVVLLVILFVFWWFYPKATVTIYLSTRKLDERVTLFVDPNADIFDYSEMILPGELVTTSVSGDKTKTTTGTKTVGEKAKGEVTLYRVGSAVTLSSATTISGPSNLKFSLDEEVAIASGSAGTPGTQTASVTAADIGAQYNLAGGTTFSVGNYSLSDIEAKNTAAFSGGSSREISAVSADDQEVLEEELTEELKNKAIDEFTKDLSEDLEFISESLTATTSSRTFSDKVGDEATTLKLSLTLDTEAVVVRKDAIFQSSKEALKDKIPEGFILRSSQVDVDFDFSGKVDGKFKLRASIVANLLPELDSKEIAVAIVGKYPLLVENYLKNEIAGFSRAEITFNRPRFPGRLGTLPRRVENIEVIIAADK